MNRYRLSPRFAHLTPGLSFEPLAPNALASHDLRTGPFAHRRHLHLYVTTNIDPACKICDGLDLGSLRWAVRKVDLVSGGLASLVIPVMPAAISKGIDDDEDGEREAGCAGQGAAKTAALDADRDARDRRVEAAVAEVLVLLERRSEIERELIDTNTTIGNALRKVLAEDVAVDGAAQLVELEPAEIRRLTRQQPRPTERAVDPEATTAGRLEPAE